MPSVKGYGGKHMDDRTRNPGKVQSGKFRFDAHGSQKPMGTISMAPKKKEKARGY